MAEPEAPAASPPVQEAPPCEAWLDTPVADGVSVVAFQLGALFVSELVLIMVSPLARLAVGAGLGALGALGCAIERGRARPLTWSGSLAVGALAAVSHLALLTAWRGGLPGGDWGELALRGGLLLILSVILTRLGSRFDRGEAGWRAACRRGPALGGSPLADRIASARLPRPLALVLLVAMPIELAARGACLGMILAYQLTASRLMPPACRYEPSCSRYGFQAYLHHGVIRGSVLTALRLLRCSPIGPGGYDPTPRPKGGLWSD